MRKDLKMIAIDLDGTLLRDDCTISQRTREAVEEAGRRGYLMVPTTGRSYRNTRFVLKGFREISYFINGNGSVISSGRTEDVLYFHDMDMDNVRKIYELAAKYDTYVEIYAGQDAYMDAKGQDVIKRCGLPKEYCDQLLATNKITADYRKLLAGNDIRVGKVHILVSKMEEKDKLIREIDLLPGVHPISVIPNNIEVVHGRWSKWNAIAKLADMVGVRQEEIMAIGDSNNDYEMLLNAGYSVAMGNACDRVKEISSAVTDTNENDGVAKAIENILNQE